MRDFQNMKEDEGMINWKRSTLGTVVLVDCLCWLGLWRIPDRCVLLWRQLDRTRNTEGTSWRQKIAVNIAV